MLQSLKLPFSTLISRRSLVNGLAFAAMLPLDAGAANAAGIVESCLGPAEAEAGGVSRSLANGAQLFLGDLVSTRETARLLMLLGTATHIRMGADTRLRIDKFLAETSGEFRFDSGPVLLDRKEGAPAMDLRLRSPYGSIALRGTVVFAGPSNGVFGVFVQRGAVDVTASGVTVRLNAGEGTNIKIPGDKP
ncbi:MAG: FecR domain-containing protein, partial [Beijerinckiaceae bacterium]